MSKPPTHIAFARNFFLPLFLLSSNECEARNFYALKTDVILDALKIVSCRYMQLKLFRVNE